MSADTHKGPHARLHTYSAGHTTSVAESVDELWAARTIVRAFMVRSLRVRYRQALLGVVWAFAQPLALLVPLTIFVGDRTPRIEGIRYAASTLAALVGWYYLSSAVTMGAGALVAESMLVRKTWFPREAPVVAAVGGALVDLAIGTTMALIAGPMLGARLGVGLVVLPIAVVGLVVCAVALALPLAAMNALYRDVRHALAFLVLLWLFASPVMYSVERVSGHWRRLYAALNPAVGPLDAFRRGLAHGTWPRWDLLGISMGSALIIGSVGHWLFRRLAPTLPDVI